MPDDVTSMLDEARRWVGAPAVEDKVGRDPVNLAMIHHWVQALEDHNPIYVDDEFASTTRHDGLVAPPAMLQTWTMDAPQEDSEGPQSQVLDRLDAAGYTSVVATNYEHDYHRELRLGDRITQRTTVEDVGEEKQTALGPGRFVTVEHTYLDQHGKVVGVGRMRLLKFKPPAATAAPAAQAPEPEEETPKRPRPAINRDNAFFWEGVQDGELRIQRCGGCQQLRHPPRPMCDVCHSTEWDHIVAGPHGRIHSYVVHHHPQLPGITTPHVVLLVDLDEGVRIISETDEGVDPAAVRIGLDVELVFKDVDEELTVPAYRPAGTDAGDRA